MHHFVEHNRQLNFLITHPIAANVSISHEMLDIKKICEWGSYSPTQHLSSKPWLNVWQPMHALILNFVCMHPMAAAVAPTYPLGCCQHCPPTCMPTRGLHPHPMPQLECKCWQPAANAPPPQSKWLAARRPPIGLLPALPTHLHAHPAGV